MKYTSYDQLPIMLTVEQITDILNIGRNTAYDLIRCGKLPSLRVGRQIRIPKEALLRYIGTVA